MPRVRTPRVSDSIAAELRQAIDAWLRRKGFSRYDLGEDLGEGLNEIGDRSIERAFSEKEPLLVDTAFELVVRSRRLGMVHNDDLCARLLGSESAIVLIPPGEGDRLADVLVAEAARIAGVSPVIQRKLGERYRRLFSDYETATQHWAIEPIAEEFVKAVRDTFARMPGGWRYHFGQLLHAAIDKVRKSHTVKKPARELEEEFFRRRASRRIR